MDRPSSGQRPHNPTYSRLRDGPLAACRCLGDAITADDVETIDTVDRSVPVRPRRSGFAMMHDPMATSSPSRRPWYCADTLVDSYKRIEQTGRGKLRMLQYLKVFRAITLNGLVAGVALFAIVQGGDPTLIGATALVALMLLNGIEASEWLAAQQALREIDLERTNDDND